MKHGFSGFSKRLTGMPLRWKLTAWYILLLAVILIAFGAFLYFSLARSLHRELDAILFSQGQQVLAEVDAENGSMRLDPSLDVLPGTCISLYDTAWRLVDTIMPVKSVSSLPAKALAPGQPQTLRVQGSEWRVLVLPVDDQGCFMGWLQVMRSQQETEAPLASLLLLIMIAIPSTLVAAAGGGLFLARRALTPIDQITSKARRISTTDLSQRLGIPHGNDEVGHLVSTLDEMLDRLHRAFQRQRQFTADASHELRTPLAVIRSQAEMVLSRDHSAEEYCQALRDIRDQAQWMGDLVSKLLLIARSDDGREQLSLETLDLVDLVEGVACEFQAAAGEKGLHLTTSIKDRLTVKGDQTHLTQLLANLVDNAVKYTPSGKVAISLERDGQWALIKVEDTGVGISPEHLPHIFERFYRVDKARSRRESGFGLGLSICDWIAQSHGGRIEAQSALGRGTTFKVFLPA